MIVLGLDPGTARLGWGVLDTSGSSPKALGYGVLETDMSLTDGQRLVALGSGLEQLFAEYSPELAGVERLFFSKNVRTAMTVSQARGLILYQLEKYRISALEFTPQQVKQGLTGNGKADKAQVQKMAQLLLRLPELPKPDDAADALAVALTAADQYSAAKRFPKV